MKFTKYVISSPKLYISHFKKNESEKNLIFIHGGPGFNCKILEYLIENENLFENLDHNLVLYDQRGCGRSKNILSNENKDSNISHKDNIDDLDYLIRYLKEEKSFKIIGLIGHSYGAKLLFDFQKVYKSRIPSIFVSTADSILTPRLRNLHLDLIYLKKENPDIYEKTLQKLSRDLSSLWEVTEELSPIFSKNPNRKIRNWCNIEVLNIVKDIDPEISFPVFISVRKDLYSSEENFSVNIPSLKMDYIWINGFHDFIMDGMLDAFSKKNDKKKIFFKSSHYPHIEENELFCKTVNNFMKYV